MNNEYIGIIYSGILKNKPIRKIHKELYDATINKKITSKVLFANAIKLSNKAKKINIADDVVVLINLLLNNNGEKIINFETKKETENQKNSLVDKYIKDKRDNKQYFYLASSHGDCAKDHKPYQGKKYIDEKAPQEFLDLAKQYNIKTIQWVMNKPAWFVTRPYCRHYFISIKNEEAVKSAKKLTRKYKAYTKEGDYDFQTPAKHMVEEYKKRLATLNAMYREHPTEKLKRMIEKTKMLIKKWQEAI